MSLGRINRKRSDEGLPLSPVKRFLSSDSLGYAVDKVAIDGVDRAREIDSDLADETLKRYCVSASVESYKTKNRTSLEKYLEQAIIMTSPLAVLYARTFPVLVLSGLGRIACLNLHLIERRRIKFSVNRRDRLGKWMRIPGIKEKKKRRMYNAFKRGQRLFFLPLSLSLSYYINDRAIDNPRFVT